MLTEIQAIALGRPSWLVRIPDEIKRKEPVKVILQEG